MTDGDGLLLVLVAVCLMADAHYAARAWVGARRPLRLWLSLRLVGLVAIWTAIVYGVTHHGG